MRRFYSFLCLPLLIMAASSCQFDDTELQNSIDDLTSRVEALEDFQEQVQGDIASLQEIISKLDSSVTVNNVVDNDDGSWTINFSDGTSVTIRNGQDGEDGLTPPSITVVEEDGTYYWAYEDADGNIKFILDDDGNKIPVTGEAPQVRINEDGYWEISTDGGKTWENTGVKAEGGDGDSFFSNVYVEDGILYLVLADGTVIKVPMTAELAFDFGTGKDTLYFKAGETKELAYTMSGQESVTVNKPDGWRVSFQGSSLSVTAPTEANVYAETEGVVNVILISASGQSLLAEQAVKIGKEVAFTIEIPQEDITATSVHVISTRLDPTLTWHADIVSQDEYDMFDGDMEAYFMNVLETMAEYNNTDIPGLLAGGFAFDYNEDNYVYGGLTPQTAYKAYAVGVDLQGNITTDFVLEDFMTLEIQSDLTFEIDVIPDVTSAIFNIYPSDPEAYYWTAIIDNSYYEDGYTEYQIMQEILDNESYSIMFRGEYYMGDTENLLMQGLSPQTEYIAVAFGFDYNTLEPNSKMASQPFTTLERETSDAYAEGHIDNYWYDGDLIAYNPSYSYYLDPSRHVIAVLDIEYNDYAQGCVYIVWNGDETGDDYWDLYDLTIMRGNTASTGDAAPILYLDYAQYTVCVIGIDADGNYGDMYVELVTLDENGVSHDYPLFDEYFSDYMAGMAKAGKTGETDMQAAYSKDTEDVIIHKAFDRVRKKDMAIRKNRLISPAF